MKRKGYIALVSVLIVSAAFIAIVTAMTISSVFILNDIEHDREKNEVKKMLDSCAQDALLQLTLRNVLDPIIYIEDEQCSVTINSHVNPNWDFTVSHAKGRYTSSVRISAARTFNTTLNSWNYIK